MSPFEVGRSTKLSGRMVMPDAVAKILLTHKCDA
jgi:hypothetical protein